MDQEIPPDELKADKERRALEELARRADEPDDTAVEALGPSAAPLPPLVIPEAGTDVLLDRQVASCAGLIEHHALHRAQ